MRQFSISKAFLFVLLVSIAMELFGLTWFQVQPWLRTTGLGIDQLMVTELGLRLVGDLFSAIMVRLWSTLLLIWVCWRIGLFAYLGLQTSPIKWQRMQGVWLALLFILIVQLGFSRFWLHVNHVPIAATALAVFSDFSIGLFEEVWFRGFVFLVLLRGFAWRYGLGRETVIVAILLSSALFGLAHLMNYYYGEDFWLTIMQVAYTFFLGIIFACFYLYSGTLWVPIILHGIFDLGVSMDYLFASAHQNVDPPQGQAIEDGVLSLAEALYAQGGFVALVGVLAFLCLRYLASLEPSMREGLSVKWRGP